MNVTEISESDASTSYPVTPVYEGRTAVGTYVIIADSPVYGRMLFLDGELQSASADERIYHEALVHPVMASLPISDASVLVVGGGEGATVREVLRWSISHVDWVDYDADLVDLCREHLNWAPSVYDDPRVNFQAADIQTANLRAQYDVIILDLPDPDGETGWLYSAEFWTSMKRRLTTRGRLVTHCGPVRLFGCIGEVFKRVREFLMTPYQGKYLVPIASFQGEWGFWMWGRTFANPWSSAELPGGLRVATRDQMIEWSRLQQVWLSAM